MNRKNITGGSIFILIVFFFFMIVYQGIHQTQYTPSGKIIDTFSCEGHKYIEFHYRGGGGSTIVHSQACPCLKDTNDER